MAPLPFESSHLFRLRALRATAGLFLAAAVAFSPQTAFAKTYLVNGILSATPIGYGFKNLKSKLPRAQLFNNLFGGEGSIRRSIVKDIRARHSANPSEQFTLAGISSGADVILQVARDVAKDGIQIHYLGIVESSGGSLPPNVQSADNFICASTGPLCTRARVSGANTISIDTGHIDLGNHPTVHSRIIANAR